MTHDARQPIPTAAKLRRELGRLRDRESAWRAVSRSYRTQAAKHERAASASRRSVARCALRLAEIEARIDTIQNEIESRKETNAG